VVFCNLFIPVVFAPDFLEIDIRAKTQMVSATYPGVDVLQLNRWVVTQPKKSVQDLGPAPKVEVLESRAIGQFVPVSLVDEEDGVGEDVPLFRHLNMYGDIAILMFGEDRDTVEQIQILDAFLVLDKERHVEGVSFTAFHLPEDDRGFGFLIAVNLYGIDFSPDKDGIEKDLTVKGAIPYNDDHGGDEKSMLHGPYIHFSMYHFNEWRYRSLKL